MPVYAVHPTYGRVHSIHSMLVPHFTVSMKQANARTLFGGLEVCDATMQLCNFDLRPSFAAIVIIMGFFLIRCDLGPIRIVEWNRALRLWLA